MQANWNNMTFKEGSRNDHKKQEEKLKTMSASPDKVQTISAELVIENLLKNSFKKSKPVSMTTGKTENFCSGLPFWLQCESTAVPSLYKQLWSLVALPTEQADTQKVSQLLLTSGLHVETLGFIWSLANKVIPGQLTKQEFYIVLALVGLAQAGCTFNSLNVLKHIKVPSIPFLQSTLLTNAIPQNFLPQNTDIQPSFHSFQQIPNIPAQRFTTEKDKRDNQLTGSQYNEKLNDSLNVFLNENAKFHLLSDISSCASGDFSKTINNIHQEVHINERPSGNSYFLDTGSSPTLELEDDFSEFQSVPAKTNQVAENMISSSSHTADEFTDFQSANVEDFDPLQTVVVVQTKEIPKILLPKSFSEKFTNLKSNVLKVSPESERRIKVLSTTESLSSLPESKISSTNTVSTSISLLGGSRLTNHSFSSKPEKEWCYKHQKRRVADPSVSPEEEVIFSAKPMHIENYMPKCHPKTSSKASSFILKETKIKNDDILKSSFNDENCCVFNSSAGSSEESTRQIRIPMLGAFSETVLPTQKKIANCFDDLISVQEDKYSALREINLKENTDVKENNDEFGDFLSANILPSASARIDPISNSVLCPIFESDEKRSWGDWNFNRESKVGTHISGLENGVTVHEPKPKSTSKEEAQDLFDVFTTLSFNEKKEYPKNVSIIKSAEQEDNFPASNAINYSKGSNRGNIVKFYDQSNKNNQGLQPKSDQFNSQSSIDFWDFLSSEDKPLAKVTLNRQGSVPNLDLKISAALDETKQEVVWRKCLESCYNLIYEGFEKFNNIKVKSILDEVFSSSKTAQYLNCLYIVYQISKRISQNFNDLPTLQEELEKFWGRLQELCFEYNIKLMSCEEEVSEGVSQCCICLKYIVCDLINQGMYSYHPSCANLWINFIERTLPFSTQL